MAAPMELDTHLARELATGNDPNDAQFRLLVESVSDYAIDLPASTRLSPLAGSSMICSRTRHNAPFGFNGMVRCLSQ
jgi:hypothetical protein